MTDAEVRELCSRFFDAYENRDVAELDKIYAPDCVIWHNVFGRETTRDENLAALPGSYKGQRRRTYSDRIINTFDDGFVIQYTLNGVQHSGHKGALWICIVGRCRDGQLTRIDEYMDSGKFAAWRGVPSTDPTASQAARAAASKEGVSR
jgi:ketosteroid isomerase-like protein